MTMVIIYPFLNFSEGAFEKFNFPKSNILSYDVSESSVFAIKQFAYLFPEFVKNPTLLVYAKNEREEEIPNMEYIEELVTRHFPDLIFFRRAMNFAGTGINSRGY